MRAFRDISLRRKLTLIIMFTSSAALLLTCGAFIGFEVLGFRRELVENLTTLAEVVGNNTTAAINFNDPQSAEETLTALRSEPNIVAACIHTASGELFATYKSGAAGAAANRPDQPPAPGYRFEGGLLELAVPIRMHDELVGTISLTANLSDLEERLWRYGGIAALVLGVSLLVAFALSRALERFVSGPILELAKLARSVAVDRDFSIRAHRHSDDELGQLIDGFNEMLSQIQLRDDALHTARDFLEQRVRERTAALNRAQEETARERARFKFIFESVPVGISFFVSDSFGTHLVNPAHERITGVSAEDSRKPLAFARVSHPDDYRVQQELVQRVNRGEIDRFSIEKRYLHPGGRVVWAEFTSRTFVDPATGEKQAVTTVVDITAVKKSQADLAYERDLLRALLETCPDSIYFKDLDSQFLRCSTAMATMFGVGSADALVGRTDRDFFGEEHSRAAFDDEQQIIRTGEPLLGKTEREVWRDGRVTWSLTSKMPLRNVAGEIIGTIGTSKDITAIKEAESKLEALHKQLLETSRQAGMAEVATGVLHNVGNVLNSVNVSATLVVEQVRDSQSVQLGRVCTMLRANSAGLGPFFTADPKGRQVPGFLEQLAGQLATERSAVLGELELLRKNIEHIKDIVAMQQSYAKVSGVVETVAVHEIVDDALRMNSGALLRHSVTLTRDFQARPVVAVERHKVLQILVNVIRNAKYACDEGGREEKQIVVRITEGDGRARVAIIDNGIGIPAENLSRVFNHGFTTRANGHGFGLHSGALAAKEMGGTLVVQSDGLGAGATVTLELPLRPPDAPAGANTAKAA